MTGHAVTDRVAPAPRLVCMASGTSTHSVSRAPHAQLAPLRQGHGATGLEVSLAPRHRAKSRPTSRTRAAGVRAAAAWPAVSRRPARPAQGRLRIAHCGGLHLGLDALVRAVNAVARLLGHPFRWRAPARCAALGAPAARRSPSASDRQAGVRLACPSRAGEQACRKRKRGARRLGWGVTAREPVRCRECGRPARSQGHRDRRLRPLAVVHPCARPALAGGRAGGGGRLARRARPRPRAAACLPGRPAGPARLGAPGARSASGRVG